MFTRLIGAMVLGAAVVMTSVTARAQDFPSQDITVIVPFPAGGPTDAIARLLGNEISNQIGKPVIVENVAGAGGTVGAARAAAAAADGHTLLMSSSAQMVLAPHVYSNLAYDGFKAFEPVGLITRVPLILQVPANSRFNSFSEVLEFGRANPGELSIGNVGLGTIQHVALELLLGKAEVEAVQVPYQGSAPATTAFLSGEVDFMIDLPSAVVPLAQSGKSKPLAVFSDERVAELPDVPTAKEQGLDFESYTWFAVMVPKGTPADRLEFLREELNKALSSAPVAEKMKATRFPPASISIEDFKTFMQGEYDSYKAAVEAANIKIE